MDINFRGFNNLFAASIIICTGKMSLKSYDTSPLGDFSTFKMGNFAMDWISD